MHHESVSATWWTLRPNISIPALVMGGLFLVCSAVVVTLKVTSPSPASALAGAAVMPSEIQWAGERQAASVVRQPLSAGAAGPVRLASLETSVQPESQSPAKSSGEASDDDNPAPASLSNHSEINTSLVNTTWNDAVQRWQTDSPLITLVNTDQQRLTASRVGGEYLARFAALNGATATQSLLAVAADSFTDGGRRFVPFSESSASASDSFGFDTTLGVLGRGAPEAQPVIDLTDGSDADLSNSSPTIDIIPRSGDAPSFNDDPGLVPGGNNGGSTGGFDVPGPGDNMNDRNPKGPMTDAGRSVPEPLAMPILLAGWLLLLRSKRNRLDLARLQQFIEESASFKLPPGSSDRTLAQLTSSGRRAGGERD